MQLTVLVRYTSIKKPLSAVLMTFGESVYSMPVRVAGQFLALGLRFERVDGAVGGTVDRSMSGSNGDERARL